MYRVAAVILASCLLSATLQTAPLAAQVNLPEGFEIVEFDVDDLMKGSPRINNCGEIVYVKDRFENSRVYLYDNGKFTRLTEYNNGLGVGQPDINEHGVITWYQAMRRTPESSQIVRYVNGRSEILGLESLTPRFRYT